MPVTWENIDTANMPNLPFVSPERIRAGWKEQNWMTDPGAPWNTWAQNLEGYLQDWVNTQREALQSDLQAQNRAAGQQAIGQGLYTGTYTSSLPAENLSRMIAQNTQGYAGAMSNLQAQALAQLMGGQQQYGSQMLAALLAEMQMKAQAESQSGGIMDFLGPLLQAGGTIGGALLAPMTGGASIPVGMAISGVGDTLQRG
jgi:hypothetical protein